MNAALPVVISGSTRVTTKGVAEMNSGVIKEEFTFLHIAFENQTTC